MFLEAAVYGGQMRSQIPPEFPVFPAFGHTDPAAVGNIENS